MLTLSQVTIGQVSIGHVVNLASNDVQRFDLVRSINSSLIHLLVFNNCFSFSSPISPSILLSVSTSSGLPLCALPLDWSPSPDSFYVPGVHRGGVECIPCHWFCGGTDPTADMPRQTLCTSQVTSVFLVWFTCINFTTPLSPFFPLLLSTSFLPPPLPLHHLLLDLSQHE